MIQVRFAHTADIPSLTTVDSLATVGSRRHHLLERAIENQQCLVAEFDSEVSGYAQFSRCFYDNMFLELVIIRANCRRKRIASALVKHVERITPTSKLFSSTNRSNRAAQEFLHHCGFVETGYIDNLDNNDPEIIYFKQIERPVK
jgi:N-acetylglutamate synthase-like GNAT family acetyltransferase